MMVRKSDGAFEQTTPSNEWSFTVPVGRTNVELIGVFSADGRTAIPFDSTDLTNGVMTIFFGIDAVAGVARYEYDIESDGAVLTYVDGTLRVSYGNNRVMEI